MRQHITQSEEKLQATSQMQILIQMSDLAEKYRIQHCTIQLYLTPGSRFATATNASGSCKMKPLIVYHAQNSVA